MAIWWIVVGVLAIWFIGCTIVRIRSGLDRKEMAVVRRAGGPSPFGGGGGGGGGGLVGLIFLVLKLLLLLFWCFAYLKHRAEVRKVVGFNPRQQNHAEGVIYHFYDLRITRTELIERYEENSPRIPLQGVTAAVTTSDTVDMSIEGPDTKFMYSMPHDAFVGLNLKRARQFAALLNYEANVQGAPPKKTPGAPQTAAPERSTKVRCYNCQHVQPVPVSQATFSCEQCKANLMRSIAPAESG
jgi:hypothetical protein